MAVAAENALQEERRQAANGLLMVSSATGAALVCIPNVTGDVA